MITGEDIRRQVEWSDRHDGPKIVANGELVVLQCEDRLFLYNRTSRHAFELLPDYLTGLRLEVI